MCYNAQCTRHATKVAPVINESNGGDTPGGELAPGPLDGIVRQNMPATVKLPLIASSQNHHVRPEDRGSRVPRHLPAARNAKLVRSGGPCCVDLTICSSTGSKHVRRMFLTPLHRTHTLRREAHNHDISPELSLNQRRDSSRSADL